MLLVAGGARDPNLRALLERAQARAVPVRPALVGAGELPRLSWDLVEDRLVLEGEELRATALFGRYDVFEGLADPRPQVAHAALAWFAALEGWARVHAGVAVVNARATAAAETKPAVLLLAQQSGLRCPATVITNEVDKVAQVAQRLPLIAKPVAGGSHCEELGDVLARCPTRAGRASSPAIVQERVPGPDLRVYRVGEAFLPFTIRSARLDYRTDASPSVQPYPLESVEPGLLDGLRRLTDAMGLDFGAADFKLDERSGEAWFLEVNSGPMFAAFDAASGGAVSDALLDLLAAA